MARMILTIHGVLDWMRNKGVKPFDNTFEFAIEKTCRVDVDISCLLFEFCEVLHIMELFQLIWPMKRYFLMDGPFYEKLGGFSVP